MNVVQNLTCKYCNKVFKDPITLSCCGKNICKKDIEEILSNTLTNNSCPFCDKEIQNQAFNINETLQVMIEEMELPKFRIRPEYESFFKNLKEKIEQVERMHKDPENAVYVKFSELRRLVDLDRENAKQEIDNISDGLISELNAFESDFKAACKSKAYTDYYEKLIERMNRKLNKYEKCFNSFIATSENRSRTNNAIKKDIEVVDCVINEYENKLYKNKSIEYDPSKNISVLRASFGKIVVKKKEHQAKTYIKNKQFMVSADTNGKINIWDLEKGELFKTIEGHLNSIRALTYIKDNGYLVSGSKDTTIKLWDVKEGKLVKTLNAHKNGVRALAYIKESGYLVSGGDDEAIKIWDLNEGKPVKQLIGNAVRALIYIKEMGYLVSGGGYGIISLWNVNEGKLVKTLPGHNNWVFSLAYIKETGYLASGGFDSTIKVWDIEKGKLVKELEGHTSSVLALAYLKENGCLASGGDDKTIRLWDLKEGKLLKTLEGHTESVTSLAYINVSKGYLASGSKDKTIKLWDLKEARLVKTLEGHSNWIYAVKYQKESGYLKNLF